MLSSSTRVQDGSFVSTTYVVNSEQGGMSV